MIENKYEEIRARIKSLDPVPTKLGWGFLRPYRILRREKALLELHEELCILRQKEETSHTANEVILREVDRDLVYLEAKFKINSHLYIKFSTTFAVIVALLSLALGVLSLVA